MNNNHVYLLGHYGSDELHAIPIWGEEKVIDKKENVIKLLQRLVKKEQIDSFKLSNFHFNLDIDYISYRYILENSNSIINLREPSGDDYIPKELCEFHSKMDIYLEDKTYFKEGTYYFDMLYDYIALGKKIQTQIYNDLYDRIPTERIIENQKYFKNFTQKINLDININFVDLVKLVKFADSTDCSFELKEIFYTMLDLVLEIPHNPFKRSFKAFGIIEESRAFNNKGEKIIKNI